MPGPSWLVTVEARKRRRSDDKRWERSRSMEPWQMDVVGGVHLADGSEAKIVSGIDDHSQFAVSARSWPAFHVVDFLRVVAEAT